MWGWEMELLLVRYGYEGTKNLRRRMDSFWDGGSGSELEKPRAKNRPYFHDEAAKS